MLRTFPSKQMYSRFNTTRPVAATKLLVVCALAVFAMLFNHGASGQDQAQNKTEQKPVDPKAWGGNHVGKPIPEYIHGDECLFCHRNDIGPGWSKNTHGVTVRQREDAPELEEILKQPALSAFAPQVEYFMGSRRRVRLLKKSGYGKLAILNTQAVMGADKHTQKLLDAEKPAWDKDRFANQCAGCHTTGVDAATKAYTAFGLDCYTCHGVVDLNHTHDTSL